MNALRFTLYGKITSNNRVTRRFGKRSVKNPDARSDESAVFQTAFVEAQRIGWVMPPAAALTIVAYNVLKDVGNIEKVIADGLQGVAFADDAQLVELHVKKIVDRDGERYHVMVEAREALVRPKPLRRMRFEDVPRSKYPWVVSYLSNDSGALLEIEGCHPLAICDVPAIWMKRMRQAMGR